MATPSLEDYLSGRGLITPQPAAAPDLSSTAYDNADFGLGPAPVRGASSNPFLDRARARLAGSGSMSRPLSGPRPNPNARSPLGNAWRTVTSPLRAISGVTGGIGGQVGRLFDPEGYAEAERELIADELGGESPRDLSLLESAGAIPGLGDVIASNISREGISGRLLRPVVQIAGNIAGDPTSYFGPGLLTGVGRATRAISKAGRVAAAAEKAGDVSRLAEVAAQIPTLQSRLEAARGAETGFGRAIRGVEEGLAGAGATGSAMREAVRSPTFGTLGRVAATVPFGPVPAIAHAPDIAEGIAGGVRQTYEDARAGRFAEAAASGAGALITSALAALVARGLTSEVQAAAVLERSLARQMGEDPPEPLGPPKPPPQTQTAILASGEAAPDPRLWRQRLDELRDLPPMRAHSLPGEDTLLPGTDTATLPPVAPPGVTLAPPTPPIDRAVGAPPELPGGEVVPVPPQAPVAASAPAPVIESRVAPDKSQSLQEFLAEAASTSTPVTIAALVERGILTPGQANTARKTSLAKVLGSEVMAGLEKQPGGGYRVRPQGGTAAAQLVEPSQAISVSEGARPKPVTGAAAVPGSVSQAAPASTTSGPADAVAPTAQPPKAAAEAIEKLPWSEIDRQLESTPGLREASSAALDDIAASRGKSLQDMSPQDTREVFPGDAHRKTRALLNRVLGQRQREARIAAADRLGTDIDVQGAETSPEVGSTPAAPPAPAPQAALAPIERLDSTIPPTAPARVPFPPREGPQGLEIVMPKPTPEIPADQRMPVTRVAGPGTGQGIEDSGVTRREVARAASRAMAPFTPPTRDVADPDAVEGPIRPLSPELSAQIGQRLAGGDDILRPTPDSPLGQVMRQRPRVRGGARAVTDDEIQNAALRWMQFATADATDTRLSPAQHRIRELLTADIDDDAAASRELAKLLTTEVKNIGGATVQRDARGRTTPLYDDSGTLALDRADAVSEFADSGLANAEIERTAIVRPTGVGAIERAAADPDYPTRPANLDDAQYLASLTPADIAQYRAAAKWALDEMQSATSVRTGKSKVATPWMEVLRPIAQQLGIPADARRGADRLIRQIGTKLERIERGGPDLAPTPLLTEALVANRSTAWQQKISAAPRIGGTDARVVDFEGDGREFVSALSRDAAPVADSLSRATQALGAAADLPARLGGLTPSPQLNGVRIADDIYVNPIEAVARGTLLGRKGDDLASFVTQDLLHTIRHEIAHHKSRHDAASGDDTFINAFARVMEDTEQIYDAVAGDLRSAVASMLPRLESLVPAYRKSQEAANANLARVSSGPGRRVIAPIPPRSGGSARGVAGDGGNGVRSDIAVSGRSTALGAGRQGTVVGEDTAPGAIGGTSRADGARPSPSSRAAAEVRAAPSASLTTPKFDISKRMSKLGDVLSDEQKTRLDEISARHQQSEARDVPVSWDGIDAATRRDLNLTSPSDFDALKRHAGIRSAADLAAVRDAVDTFTADTHDKRAALIEAAKGTDKAAASRAQDELGVSYARRMNALSTLAPTTEPQSKVLRALRMMAHGLQPDESFRERFYGSLEATGVKSDKVDSLWQMYQDTIDYENKHGVPGAMGETFSRAFLHSIRPTIWEKVTEFWKAGLLGIPTQITNITGNAAFLPYRNLEHGLSAMADALISGVTGAPRTRYMNEITGRMIGQREALRDILPMLGEGLSDIAHLRPLSQKTRGGGFSDTQPELRRLFGAISGKRGEFVRNPFKALDLTDDITKHLIRMGEFGARASNLAHNPAMRSAGESVQHASNRIYQELKRIADDPGHNWALFDKKVGPDQAKLYRDTLRASEAAMLNDVWQKPLGDFGKSVDKVFRDYPALEFVLPFRKTPYNILAEGLKRTPLGVIPLVQRAMAGKLERGEGIDRAVKSMLGTTVMGVAAGLALDGTLTGGGPADPKQQEQLRRTGWIPRSIKIGDTYIPYARVEPFATILGLGSDLAEAWKRKDIDTAEEITTKLAKASADNITDKSFLHGMQMLLNITLGNTPGGRSAAIRQLQASLIPGQVGLVAPIAHAARAIDPYYRETEAFTASPFMANLPGVSELLPPQYAPSGEKRERPGTPLSRFISPFQTSRVKTDAASRASAELVRLDKSIEKPPLYIKIGDTKVYYTDEQRAEIGKAQERALDKIGEIVSRSSYTSLPDRETPDRPNARTKGDIILSVKNNIVGPVKKRIDADVTRRARRGV